MTEIETFSRLDNAAAKQDLHTRQIQLQEEFWKEERRTQLSDMTSSRNLYTKKRRRTGGIKIITKLQVLIKIDLNLDRGGGVVYREI